MSAGAPLCTSQKLKLYGVRTQIVGTLPAAIRVQLVEDKKPKPFAIADNRPIDVVLACHQQLEHHEVRQKNVGRVVGDTLPLDLKPDALVAVRCGNVTLSEGRMGRVGDRVAVRVSKPLRKPKTTFAMFESSDKTTNRMEGP